MKTIEQRIKSVIRDIPDFPKPGIIFRDITPVLLDVQLRHDIVTNIIDRITVKPDVICAI